MISNKKKLEIVENIVRISQSNLSKALAGENINGNKGNFWLPDIVSLINFTRR